MTRNAVEIAQENLDYAPVLTIEPDPVEPLPGPSMVHYMAAILVCAICNFIGIIVNSNTVHWFLLPCTFCGILMGADTIAWLRGKFDTFDPRAMVGLVGFHFFYLSAVIFISRDMVMPYVTNPDDWRPWVGIMGSLNAAGLILYRLGCAWGQSGRKVSHTIWRAKSSAFPILMAMLMLSIFCQMLLFVKFGGFKGLLATKEQVGALGGMGIPKILGTSLPLLVFTLVTFMRMNNRQAKGNSMGITILLFIVGGTQLILSGYYGSRGDMVFPIFWILVLVHHLWKKIKPKYFLLLIAASMPFMVIYGIFKTKGMAALYLWRAAGSADALMAETGRTPVGVLIGDLSRTDVHAFMVHKLIEEPETYDLRKGETYLYSWTPMVPRWIWSNKPSDAPKVMAGTEILHGKGYYRPYTRFYSSRVYGLAGEAMLNFGVWAAPIPFLAWGFFVGRLRKFLHYREPIDLRILIMPYMIWMAFNLLIWDWDNHISHTFLRALVTLITIRLCVSSVPNPRLYQDTAY